MVWRALTSKPLIISETKITILTNRGLTNALESDLNRWRHIRGVRFAVSGEKEWEEELGNWWRSCSERRCDNTLMGRVVHVICEMHRSLAGSLSVRNLIARCHLLHGEAFESTPDGVYGGSCSSRVEGRPIDDEGRKLPRQARPSLSSDLAPRSRRLRWTS
jgi:hypothetical protein